MRLMPEPDKELNDNFMNQNDVRKPFGGLDTDTENRDLAPNDYRYGLNGRSGTSDQDSVGAVEGIRGNKRVVTGLDRDEDIIIGSCPDIKNNAIIFFVYRLSAGEKRDFIGRYFVDSGTWEYLTNPDFALMGGVFNFSLDHKIINPKVIDAGFTQLLTWTDGFNPPRLIDIDKMKVGGVYYTIAADDQYCNLAKKPPNYEPTAVAQNDSTTKANFLLNQNYQFTYRWIYDDFQISSDSPISDIYYVDNSNNYLQVTVNTGHHTVIKIQILVRQDNGVAATGNENPEWYIFKTLNKTGLSDNVSTSVSFYGNELLLSVARVDTDKLFEVVPALADHIEVVSTDQFGEQIMLGAVTEGKDNVDLNITSAVDYASNGIIIFRGASAGIEFVVTRTVVPQAGDIMYVAWTHIGTGTFYFNYVLSSSDVSSALNMANKLAAELTSHGVPSVTVIHPGNYIVQSSDVNYTIDRATSIPPILQYDAIFPDYHFQRGMKYGTQGKVGIIYYNDFLVQTGVQYISDYIIPIFNQRGTTYGTLDGDTDVGFLPQIKLTINNLPPSWATKFKIVFFEGTKYFWQVNVSSTSQTTFTLDSIPLGYTFSVGDRIRTVGSDTPLSYNDWGIKSFDPATKILTLEAPNVNRDRVDLFAEIYNINKVGDQVFYFEYPTTFNIVGGYHQGNLQNQTVSQPAILTATNDFCYYRVDWAALSVPVYYTESQSLLMSIYTPYNNKGRPQIETPTQREQKYIDVFRWSGRLLTNTQVNDLSVWDEGNYSNVDPSKGNITGLRQIGYTLTILQWSNISKTFLGRRQVSNADGSTQLVVTDNLIGIINPSEKGFGTKHPGSVSVNGDNLYFLDTLKGKFIRSATNGEFAISDYKAARYWRDKSDLINSSPNYEVITGIDVKFSDVYITVRNVTDNTQETIYFNETQNRWKYFVDMQSGTGDTKKIIDWYGWVGQSFFTFMGANIWQQGTLLDGSNNPKYLNLFGEDKELVVETIGMIEPDKVKVFDTHALHVNLRPTKVEFFIPPNEMLPNGMYSYLTPGNYSYKEGVFYAAIKNDWFTKGIPADDTAGRWQIAGGRPLRGHVVLVKIHYTTNDYVVLFSSTVGMIASEKS